MNKEQAKADKAFLHRHRRNIIPFIGYDAFEYAKSKSKPQKSKSNDKKTSKTSS